MSCCFGSTADVLPDVAVEEEKKEETSSKDVRNIINIGGIYTDPLHSPINASANVYNLNAPWFGGLRFVGGQIERRRTSSFVCIGCDDGINFWTLYGQFTDLENREISMDFTPKAPGIGVLKVSFEEDGALAFLDDEGHPANIWSRLKAAPHFDIEPQNVSSFNEINGMYVDKKMFKRGSFGGIRIVSDRLGKVVRDELCVIGTDDGVNWWLLEGGRFTDKEKGQFSFGDGLTGTCYNGTLKFYVTDPDEGRTEWHRVQVKSDFHSLPTEKGEDISRYSIGFGCGACDDA